MLVGGTSNNNSLNSYINPDPKKISGLEYGKVIPVKKQSDSIEKVTLIKKRYGVAHAVSRELSQEQKKLSESKYGKVSPVKKTPESSDEANFIKKPYGTVQKIEQQNPILRSEISLSGSDSLESSLNKDGSITKKHGKEERFTQNDSSKEEETKAQGSPEILTEEISSEKELFKDSIFSKDKLLGKGKIKEAYLVSTSLERYQKVESHLEEAREFESIILDKTDKRAHESTSKLQSRAPKLAKKIANFINSINLNFKKPERVGFNHLFNITLDTFLANNKDIQSKYAKLDNLTKSIEQIASKLRFSFENDKTLQDEYPCLTKFLSLEPPLTVKYFVSNSKESKKFIEELDSFLNQPRIVAYTSTFESLPKDFENEIKKTHFVKSALKNNTNPLKSKLLAVPLVITKYRGNQGLVGRYFNLGDVRNLLGSETIPDTPNRLSPKEKLSVAIQTADALSILHEVGIVHRDLSARNILAQQTIDKNGDYKFEVGLTDFGLAGKAGSSLEIGDFYPFHSSAPEVISLQSVSDKADSWSFGILLLELIEPSGSIDKILGDPDQYANELRNNPNHVKTLINKYLTDHKLSLDNNIKNLIFQCLDEDPDKRPSTKEIAKTLKDFQEEGKVLEFLK